MTHDPHPSPLPSLPWYTEYYMTAHRVLTRDEGQHAEWQERVDGIRLSEALVGVKDHELKARLRQPGAWRHVRRTGSLGTSLMLFGSALWLSMLVPMYAVGHGFGWLAAMSFLLPVPIALGASRVLFQNAAIEGLARRPKGSMRRWLAGTFRAFGAGYGFGFVLLFLQGLISWFMTPAPNMFMEIVLDGVFASFGGVYFGVLAMVLGPLVAFGREHLRSASRSASKRSDSVLERLLPDLEESEPVAEPVVVGVERSISA